MSLFDDVPAPRRSARGRRAARSRGRGAVPRQPSEDAASQGTPPGVSPDGRGDADVSGPAAAPGGAGSVETVGQLTARIHAALQGFGRVAVEGEISRPKTVASGHVFFTLKDSRAAIDAKIWRGQLQRALLGGVRLEDGAKVVCHGTLDVYAPYGKHSLIVDRVEVKGLGAWLADLERLKAALRAEGLFERARPLPRFPRVVGVVTSRDADAWRDFLRTRSLRWPGYPVRMVHTRVQGKTAAREIAAAIARLDDSGVDVIVVCRGGGAIEDLWCFNEESVARAIWAARVPVVTGVGHESDTTLADFVADHRAHTPTDAAQSVLPDRRALSDAFERACAYLADAVERLGTRREDRVARAAERLRGVAAAHVAGAATRLERVATRLERQSPLARVSRDSERVRALGDRMHAAMRQLSRDREQRLGRATEGLATAIAAAGQRAAMGLAPAERALAAVSPLAVLDRGYSITRARDGSVITDPSELHPGAQLTTIVRHGEVDSTVEAVRPPATP